MLSLLISLSPSGGLTRVWQIMAMLILARTQRLDGWERREMRSDYHALRFSKGSCMCSPVHRCGPQRNCTLARCRGRSRCWPRSSSLQTDRARPSETLAIPAVTQGFVVTLKSRTAESTGRTADFGCAHLVCLINNCCIIRQCFHNVEVFNGG